MAIKTYIYEYRVSVVPNKTKNAKHKGSLVMWAREPEFVFFAPNDDTAYEILRARFQPDDPRPLEGYNRLSASPRRVEAPANWNHAINVCIEEDNA